VPVRIIRKLGFFIFLSCSDKETYEIIPTEISVDLDKVPYAKLSEYHFFKGDVV
jgi:hypothetical protein